MAWWDDLLSFGSKVYEAAKPVAETAFNFAKENPTTTGAGLGALYNASQGKNVFEGAGAGALLGWGAGQAFGGGSASPSQVAAGMTPQTAVQAASSAPGNAMDNLMANTKAFGTASPAGSPTAFGAGVGEMWDSAKTGMSKLQEFGADKKNRALLEMGMKGAGSLMDYNAGKENEQRMQEYVGRERAVNDANTATVQATNKGMEDVYANQKALIGSVGQNEVASQKAATGRAIAGIQKQSGLSTGAKAALSRSTGVQGSQAAGTRGTSATLNAMAGLRAPTYQQQSAPQSNMGVAAGNYARSNTQTVAKDLNRFGRDLFGFGEEDKKQVNGAP